MKKPEKVFLYEEITRTIYKEFAKRNLSFEECKEVLAKAVRGLDHIKPWCNYTQKAKEF